MERTLYPGVGTGQTTALQFFARSVRINSGQNFVTIQPWGYVIPPNVIGNIYLLPTAVETAQFDITAPPAGTAPVGPSQQTQTALTYFDYAQQPSPGTVGTPQTIAQLGGNVPTSLFTVSVGLARAVTMTVQNPTIGGIAFLLDRLFLNAGGQTFFNGTVAAGTYIDFCFGFATVFNPANAGGGASNAPSTFHLPNGGLAFDAGGAGLVYDLRIYY